MKNKAILEQYETEGWYEIQQPRTKFVLGKNDKWQKADNGKQLKFSLLEEARGYLDSVRRKGNLIEFYYITTITPKGASTEVKCREVGSE